MNSALVCRRCSTRPAVWGSPARGVWHGRHVQESAPNRRHVVGYASNKAVVIKGFDVKDPLSQIEVLDLSMPSPAVDEVLVRITLRPVHPADVSFAKGFVSDPSSYSFPTVLGIEGVGEVAKIGAGVKGLKVGDRVVTLGGYNTEHWQQYAVRKSSDVFVVPDDVSEESACQLYVNPLTAIGMLDILDIPKGGFLLQTCGTSCLARIIEDLAKHRGVDVINVVSRPEAVAELKSKGSDHVVLSGTGDLLERVKDITSGEKVDAAIDALAGSSTSEVATAVRDRGTVLVYGALTSRKIQVSVFDIVVREISLKGFTLPRWRSEDQGRVNEKLKEVISMADKVFVPWSGEKFVLEDAKEAILASQARGRGGKVLLEG
ncbi:hypothetical protein BSKO_08900 [Bryopsis sp. KO-2023]|nr:hypothetical protein BSKO_08900 [Bryopsis sp. KO-2023]